MSFVSIITPAFGAESTIARAVDSVLAQTHQDWEMIVIADDGQDYQRILAGKNIADPRLRFATTGRIGAGPGVARNAGLDMAKHDIVANLDADDVYAPDFLSQILPAVALYGACTCSMRVVDALDGKVMPAGYSPKTDQSLAMYDIMRYCPTFAPIVFNRRWCDVRWPQLHYGEDLLFWLLLLDQLPAIYYVAAARYDYYFRKGSLSRPDEKTTHGLCERRDGMIAWLSQQHSPVQNQTNREILKRWLTACNDMEEVWGYQLVDISVYMTEINRCFASVFSRFDAVCNMAYS